MSGLWLFLVKTRVIDILVLEGDLRHANRNSMLKWLEVYPEHLHVALTDTYGTEVFLKDFVDDDEEVSFATTYRGVRQDSGDPFKFVDRIISHYKSQAIDPTTKYIVFSDSLTVDKCIALRKYCLDKKGPISMFGIGTHFTNDFHKKSDPSQVSEALNIVMKLATCAEKPVVKLSDDLGKHQGNVKALEEALQIFTIE
jgi:nicotinate phosphoribosyltransferase